jgi:hypothetical protein
MWTMKHPRAQHALLGVFVAGLALFAFACGGSSDSGTTTSSSALSTTASSSTTAQSSSTTTYKPSTAEEATIMANWVKFFDGSVAPQDKIGLLENGQQYEKQLEANAASPLAKSSTASVSSVTVTSPTAATVKYSILIGGQPALPDQTGQAVLQDGVWKVGAQSFLALLALQGGSPVPTSTTSK